MHNPRRGVFAGKNVRTGASRISEPLPVDFGSVDPANGLPVTSNFDSA